MGYADAKGRWRDSEVNISRVVIPDNVADAIEECKSVLDKHFNGIKEKYSFAILQLDDAHSGKLVAAFSPYVGVVTPHRKSKGSSPDGKD